MEQMEQDGTKWNKQNQMEQVFQIIQENPKRNQTDANGIIWEQLGDEENNRQINVPAEEGKENQIQGSETRCAYKSGCQTTRREGRTMQYEKERAERKRNSGRENPDGEGGGALAIAP